MCMDKHNMDKYYMDIAEVVSKRSRDPHTKVGAIIVKDNKIISTGYNTLPRGMDDDAFVWDRTTKDVFLSKYSYVVHAEQNAIVGIPAHIIDGSSIYVTLFPCEVCAKLIIQSNIKHIYYGSDKYHATAYNKVAKYILEKGGVKWTKL